MLTDKQEMYIQNLLSGMSQRQAYRAAYPKARKWKDSAVDSRASTLLHTKKVFERYTELKEKQENELKEKRLWEAEDAIKGLKWVLAMAQVDMKNKGVRQANSSALINAIKELNEIVGLKAKDQAQIEKINAEIMKLKGLDAEIEDLEAIEGEIYGD